MIRYYSFDQRSDKWKTYRRDRWTGSTAIDLLKGKKTPPESNSDFDNKYMQRGRILEPLAIEAYEKSVGKLGEVSHFGFITNSKYKHAGYSPDGIVDKTLLEVKCLNEKNHKDLLEHGVPVKYQAQIQFGLLISELPQALLIAYNPDAEQPLFWIEYKADKGIQTNLIKHLKETEPKRKPSQARAAERYVKNNAAKIKEARHKRYIANKKPS